MARRPKLTWKEAVAKGKVDQINRYLSGQGYQLLQNPRSVTVTNENGDILFRSRSPQAAVKRIEELQNEVRGEPLIGDGEI